MADLVGKILSSRYRVESKLGGGGMAEVYKAWDQDRATCVALKVLRQDLARDRVFLNRFHREAQTLETLQHPNIVRFYGIERDDLTVFLVMDYIQGKTLQDVIFSTEDTPLNRDFVNLVMGSICAALHYAHKQGLVHCDIKPANVMIDSTGRVMVADFGIARMTDAATATMVGFGTPAYMAPELVQGKDPTPQSDLYSLGVVLYEMVTGGERPFTGERAMTTGMTSEKVRWEQVNLMPPNPRLYNPDISPQLKNVILKCLAKDPGLRFTSALALLNEAAQAMDGGVVKEDVQQVGKERASTLQRSKKSSGKPLLCVGIVGGLGVIFVGLLTIIGISLLSISRGEKSRIGDMSETNAGATMTMSLENTTAPAAGFSVTQQATPTQTEVVKHAQVDTALPSINPTGTFIPTSTLAQTDEPTPKQQAEAGATRINSLDGAVMIYIPADDFLMGSESGNADDDEGPEHTVYLDAYWIYKYEVTNAQFAAFLNKKGNQIEEGTTWLDIQDPDVKIRLLDGTWEAKSGYADHPVIEVSWHAAQAYCEWAGGKLPTEAEWEKAARGTDGRTYPWGEKSPHCGLAGFDDCDQLTMPVGSYPKGASPYGALDMSGNAWEWVIDWFDSSYYGKSPYENPQGPNEGESWVIRGGSWSCEGDHLRATYRYWGNPGGTYDNVGFRCSVPTTP